MSENIIRICKALLVFLLFAQPSFGQHDKHKELKGLKSIELEVEKASQALRPGAHLKLGITVIFEDGKREQTKGFLKGNLKWALFDITVKGGSFDPHSGELEVTQNHSELIDYRIRITATPAGHPELEKSLELPVAFTGQFNADYRGASGHHGKGSQGQNLNIYVKTSKTSEESGSFLWIYIQCPEKPERNSFFILDPKEGFLTVDASGGEGSRGAAGAWGGSGAGNGGNGGKGQEGGDGGNIQLYVDPAAASIYKSHITIQNQGGKGGAGGHGGNPGAKGGQKGKEGQAGTAGKDGTLQIHVEPVELPGSTGPEQKTDKKNEDQTH